MDTNYNKNFTNTYSTRSHNVIIYYIVTSGPVCWRCNYNINPGHTKETSVVQCPVADEGRKCLALQWIVFPSCVPLFSLWFLWHFHLLNHPSYCVSWTVFLTLEIKSLVCKILFYIPLTLYYSMYLTNACELYTLFVGCVINWVCFLYICR